MFDFIRYVLFLIGCEKIVLTYPKYLIYTFIKMKIDVCQHLTIKIRYNNVKLLKVLVVYLFDY